MSPALLAPKVARCQRKVTGLVGGAGRPFIRLYSARAWPRWLPYTAFGLTTRRPRCTYPVGTFIFPRANAAITRRLMRLPFVSVIETAPRPTPVRRSERSPTVVTS